MKRKQHLVLAALASATAHSALATPSVTQTSDSHGNYYLVNNGAISFQLYSSGSLAGKITSIVYDGQQIVGSKGIYYDIQGSPGIYLGAGMSYTVAGTGSNFIDITARNSAAPVGNTTAAGLEVTWHWLLVDGQPGFSQYLTYHHTTDMAPYYTNENRLGAEFFNGSLFHYSSIADNFWGVQDAGNPFRDQGTFITGETADVRGIPGEYIKNYETKYDWRTTYQKAGGITGIFGQANTSIATKTPAAASSNYGLWNIVTPREYESWNAGPTHPQTPVADGASIIPSPPGSHFGGPGILLTGNVDKAYGPFYTYFNKGANISALRNDAKSQIASIDSIYDNLKVGSTTNAYFGASNYYQSAGSRAQVAGTIRLGDGSALTGATVILSAFDSTAYSINPIGQEYQRRAAGYNYWVSPNADGTFTLPDVRQGVYRLTVIKPGNFREGTFDNITVSGTGTTNLGNLAWSPDISGKGVFQVGTFDRTAGEFRDGKNYNNWLGTFNEQQEFRNGVNLVINPANPFNDTANWSQNWPLYQENGTMDFFHVSFPLAQLPAAGTVVSFTVAVAAEEFINSLGYAVNGASNQIYAGFDHEADNAPSVYRSGDTTSQVLYRKTNLTVGASGSLSFNNDGKSYGNLVVGNNDLRLHIVGGNMQYDALRLDIIGPQGSNSLAQFNGGSGNWSDNSQWSSQYYGYTAVNKGQQYLSVGVTNTDYPYDTTSSFYDSAGNRAPMNQGTSTYDATLNGGTVTLDISPTVQKLSLLQGTIQAGATPRTITVNDAFVFAGATVSGTGAISALSTTFVNFSNVVTGGFVITSTGAVTMADGAAVTISGLASRWSTPGLSFGTSASSSLTVLGGTFSTGSGSLAVGQYGVLTTDPAGQLMLGSLINAGTASIAGGTTISTSFTNSGVATVSGNISGGATVSNFGGLLTLSGLNSYAGPTVITGGGVLFAAAGAIGGSGQSVQIGAGGAAGFGGGVTSPAFLARVAPSSAGAFALTAADAATDLDFTSGGLAAFPQMGIGAIGTVTYTANFTPAGNVYELGGGGGLLNYVPKITGAVSVIIGNTGSSGQVTLSPSNDYTGATTLRGGILAVSVIPTASLPSMLGASDPSAANLVLDGATLLYTGAGASSTDRLMTLTSAGGTLDASGAGSVNFYGTGNMVASGTGNRTLVLTGSGVGTLAAGIADPSTGTTSLTKTGTGTWSLGAGVKTYSGDTTVLGGTLKLVPGAGLPISRGALVIETGATFDIVGQSISIGALNDGPVDPSGATDPMNPNTPAGWATPNGPGGGSLANSGTSASITLGQTGASGLFSGVISGNTNLVKAGPGTQVLSGDNLYSGTTTISGGTLQVGNGGTPNSYGPGDGGFTGKLGTGNIINNATLVFNRGYLTTVTNTISGSGVLKQVANANLILGSANTYTGPTIIGGGIANIGFGSSTDLTGLAFTGDCMINASSLKNGGIASSIGASSNAASNLILDGGTLYYSVTSAASTDRLFTVTQNGGAIWSSGTLSFTNSGPVLFTGSGDRTLKLEGDGSNPNTFALAINDPAAGGVTTFAKDHEATWILTSPSNSYSGDTQILMGTLKIGTNGKLPFGPGKGNVVYGYGADFNSDFPQTLDLNGNDLSINAISGGQFGTGYSILTNSSSTKTITIGYADASGDFNGNITGSINIIKTGAGIQTFEGTDSSTGAITVSGGQLIFSATSSIAGSAKNITVNNGGILGAPGTTLNQTFLNRIASGSTGVLAITSSSSNSFDFSATGANLPNLTLGTVGSATYSGILTGYNGIYRFGGGSGVLTVTSNLTGATNSLTAAVNGTFILAGTNGYGGSTTVSNAAVVEFINTSALSGGTSASITLAAGGTVAFGYPVSQAELSRIAPGSAGVFALGTNTSAGLSFAANNLTGVSLGAFGSATYSGVITPASNGYLLGGGGALTLSTANSLTGALPLTVVGPGLVAITASQSFTGPVTIGPGAILQATLANGGSASGLGASSNAAANLILAGGTLKGVGGTDRSFTLTASSTLDQSLGMSIGTTGVPIVMAPNTNLTLTLAGTATSHQYIYSSMADPVGGQFSILKTGTGTWSFNGSVKTYTGDTHIAAGLFELFVTNIVPAQSNLVIDAGASVDFRAHSETVNGLSGGGTVSDSFSSSQQNFTVGGANGGGTFSGAIQGNLQVIKNGTGTQYLIGTNTYGYGTVINAGILAFGGPAGMGTGTTNVSVGSGGAVASLTGGLTSAFLARIAPTSSGVLALTSADANLPLNYSAAPLSGLNSLFIGALGSVTYSGAITAPVSGVLQLGGAGGALTVATSITGAKSLLIGPAGVSNPGVVILTGNNAYSGPTTVQRGELQIAGVGSLPAGTALSVLPGARLTLNLGAGGPNLGDKVLQAATVSVAGAAHGGAISPTGRIDLTDNDAIIPAASYSLDEVRRLIGSAYAGGAWTGQGLGSSTITAPQALGYLDSSLYQQITAGSTFDGITLLGSQTLVKFTYTGDTDFNGYVDANDLSNLFVGLHGGLTGWVNGDTNFDNVVDNTDLANFLLALRTQGAPLGENGANGNSVPEPGNLMALLLPTALLTRRRR